MAESSLQLETVLEVVAPDKSRQRVNVDQSPFYIGRGGENDNHLQLADGRISRKCATLIAEEHGYRLEDRGNRYGVFVNGAKVERRVLRDGDTISFGIEGCYEIIFRGESPADKPPKSEVDNLLTRIGSLSDITGTAAPIGLSKLNLLLEATSLLHSELPLDAVLGTMLDHAISITHADRGLLIEQEADGKLRVQLARLGNKGDSLRRSRSLSNPSQTAVNQAIRNQTSVITEDLNLAGIDLKAAESIVIQGLRAVVAIPLYSTSRGTSDTGAPLHRGDLLGVIYVDSRRIAAFSAIDRQILDALAVQAASIIDNARLVERERERQRMEQELSIARTIQQALLPRGLNDYPHLVLTGSHRPCHEVGGDYFDVVEVSEERTADSDCRREREGPGSGAGDHNVAGVRFRGFEYGRGSCEGVQPLQPLPMPSRGSGPVFDYVYWLGWPRRSAGIHQSRASLAAAYAQGESERTVHRGIVPRGTHCRSGVHPGAGATGTRGHAGALQRRSN